MTPRHAKLPTLLTLLIAALTWTPGAGASEINYVNGTATYKSAPGEFAHVTASIQTSAVYCGVVQAPCLSFVDLKKVTRADGGCDVAGGFFAGSLAACPLPTRLVAYLGSTDDDWADWEGDSIIYAGGGDGDLAIGEGEGDDDRIDGRGGDDVIHGGMGDDVLNGAAGNDLLYGDEGDDTLTGGLGDDHFEGRPREATASTTTLGRDSYSGGGGRDSVSYASRSDGLALSADGVANDGATGEGDDIAADITSIYGGRGADQIAGGANGAVLEGGAGDDQLTGGDGDDLLRGGPGSDALSGASGADVLGGDNGNDVLTGGAGVDRFWGDDVGACIEVCASGADRIEARDGALEAVNCGPGTDTARVDESDAILTDPAISDACESVDAADRVAPAGDRGEGEGSPGPGSPGPGSTGPGSPGPGSTDPGSSGADSPRFALSGPVLIRRGAIVLRVSAPGPGKLSVRATAARLRVASSSRTLGKGGPVTITLKPSAAARRTLRTRGRLNVTLAAKFKPAGGAPTATTIRARVTLRRSR